MLITWMGLAAGLWAGSLGDYTRVLTKVSEGLFLGTVFLSCWQAVGELSASQRHNWQTVVFNVVMVRVSFGERERVRER